MKVRGITKSFGFYVGDHTRPMVERLVDASGNLSDEIWSIPIDAAAIRDAGVRCETCRHWRDGRDERWPDYNGGYCSGPPCEYFSGDEYTGETPSNFFCASHSLLTQPSEGKE